jgi:hypothetical protein
MAIQFSCPTCGKSLKAPETSAGQMAKCPYCQTHLQVPEPVAADVPVQAEEVPEATYGMQPAAETPPAEDRRPCPMCGEMIKVDAAKCRFCGEIFDETLKRAEKKRSHGPADTDLTVAEWLVAILCANIGCIVSIVWMIQGKPKGTKMFVVSLCAQVGWAIIGFLFQIANQRP